MKKEKKTNSEFIIDALRSGKELRSPEITQKVSELSNKVMKIQDIASILAKLSNSEKCDLGFFIQKKKTHKGYTYNLAKEALNLAPEQTYDLTRKTGKDRYTLEQAISDYPDLKKHVKASRLKPQGQKRTSRRGRKPAGTPAMAPVSMKKSLAAADLSAGALSDLVARFLYNISAQGGLNINVNLNVRFTGSSGE